MNEMQMTPAESPPLPTLPEPSAEDRAALEVALRSPAPVVVIPPAFNRPAADNQDVIHFAASCRRVIAPVGDQLVAVRPKPSCNTCNGSARWVLLVKGQRHACECVKARLSAAMGISRKPATPAALQAPAPNAPPPDAGRTARLAEMQERLAKMERERDAALAPLDARIGEHEAAEVEAGARVERVEIDMAELAAEMELHERAVERYERLAEEERQAVRTLRGAREERAAERVQIGKAVASATADRVAAVAERQRVVARWEERMRSTVRGVERLRGKVGVAASEPANEVA